MVDCYSSMVYCYSSMVYCYSSMMYCHLWYICYILLGITIYNINDNTPWRNNNIYHK
jgi:hypothetical protein